MRAKLKWRITAVFGVFFCVMVIEFLFEPHLSMNSQRNRPDSYIKRRLAAKEWTSDSREDLPFPGSSDLDTDLNFELDTIVTPTLTALVKEMNKRRLPEKTDTGEDLNIYKYGPDQEYGSEADLPSWQRFQNHITRYKMYSEGAILDQYLEDMATLSLVDFETIPDKGTQFKLVFELEDGARAMSKPKRSPIDFEATVDQYTFDEFERFQAEIVGFHLDKVLQFYRVPPVAGRIINVTAEIKMKARKDLRKTFYLSRVGNVCFYGVCDQFCLKAFPHCAKGHMLEFSFAAYLPTRLKVPRKSWANPWAQSYRRGAPPIWHKNATFCHDVKEQTRFAQGRRLLDIMDVAAFDFLTGNLDRHSYHTFRQFSDDSNIILYDNGRGFGRPKIDIRNLLAPIYQCCQIRLSTLEKLLRFETGATSLSETLRKSLSKDKVNPLLTESHFAAFDRRVKIILDTVYKCVVTKKGFPVVIDDGF